MNASRANLRRIVASFCGLLVCSLAVGACGEDDFDPAADAAAGASGAPGKAGSAGAVAGSGGKAGGPAGSGGISGGGGAKAGSGGTGGAGASGSAGAAGSAGASGGGSAGQSGAAGSGGAAAGACDTSSPPYKCLGKDVLLFCDVNKKEYVTLAVCKTGETCDAGRKQCNACAEGQANPAGECVDGSRRNVCAPDLKGYGTPQVCGGMTPLCVKNVCVVCAEDKDCPNLGKDCTKNRCEGGACTARNLEKGALVSGGTAGTCSSVICDGNGATTSAPTESGVSCGDGKACDGTGTCRPCLPAPGAADGSTVRACSEGLLCDDRDVSNDTGTFFVSAAGGNDASPGTSTAPFATLGKAVEALKADPTKTKVFIAEGTYVENVKFFDVPQPVVVEGGFSVDGSLSWRRSCAPSGFAKTKLFGVKLPYNATNVTLAISTSSVELRSLTVAAVAYEDNEFIEVKSVSVYAIIVATGTIKLTAVDVRGGQGSSGYSAGRGDDAPPPFSGECPGLGGVSAPGVAASGGAQTVSGALGATGFVPGTGEPGKVGYPGSAGVASSNKRESVITKCGGTTFADCEGSQYAVTGTVSLPYGNVGCPGQPGGGGRGGNQGGGSFGLYWLAGGKLTLSASRLAGGRGGHGSAGGKGAVGSFGAEPVQASAPLTPVPNQVGTCVWGKPPGGVVDMCRPQGAPNPPLFPPVSGASPGFQGDTGGDGGPAMGGPAFALVAPTALVVNKSALSSYVPGEGGLGAFPAVEGPGGGAVAYLSRWIMRRSYVLAVLLSACTPTFNDTYCAENPTPLPPKCAAYLATLGGSAGSSPLPTAGSSGIGGGGGRAGSENPGGGGRGGLGGASGIGGSTAGSGGIGGAGGKSGAGGSSGASGISGSGGLAGASGNAGQSGASGASGNSGTSGASGTAGASGSPPTCTLGKPACSAVQTLALGASHACLVRKDNFLYCWGKNDFGQLGTGTVDATTTATPKPVANLFASSVSASASVTCALLYDGTTSCWGDDTLGQLGRGAVITGNARAKPTLVAALPASRAVTVGPNHVCAIDLAGKVRCWGDNRAAQLAPATGLLSRVPTSVALVAQPAPATDLLALDVTRACSIQADGSVWCFGTERFLDDGPDGAKGAAPVPDTSASAELAVGRYFGCARQIGGGTVSCWGRGDEGQLGTGDAVSTNRRSAALVVPDLENVVSVAAGDAHVCAAVSTGQVFCWGACAAGQCGDDKTVGGTLTVAAPTLVPSVSNVARVFAGGSGTCALLKSGLVRCWGAVAGAAPTSSPVPIALP